MDARHPDNPARRSDGGIARLLETEGLQRSTKREKQEHRREEETNILVDPAQRPHCLNFHTSSQVVALYSLRYCKLIQACWPFLRFVVFGWRGNKRDSASMLCKLQGEIVEIGNRLDEAQPEPGAVAVVMPTIETLGHERSFVQRHALALISNRND
jgi:hypothetical protein